MLQKIKNRQPQAGFTLVELLIVIVVIAILAAIAITAFAGVQAKARDAQRQADIKQVASQLELYYTDNGNFPTTAQMTASGASSIFGGLSPDAMHEPQDTSGDKSNSFVDTATPTKGQYGYKVYEDGTNSTACTTAANCQSFKLYYYSEQDKAVKSVDDVSGAK